MERSSVDGKNGSCMNDSENWEIWKKSVSKTSQ
jgi:hypothetical protein